MGFFKNILRKIILRYATQIPSSDTISDSHAILNKMFTITADRPLNINIETTTICNSRCCFCGYSKIKRETELMSNYLFEKIIDEYAELCGGGAIGFSPLMSDPLMDPLIMERIRTIQKSNYNFWPHMFTNAIGFSNFSDSDMEVFLHGLKFINISMGGPDRERYLKMYNVDKFDQVVNNIERIKKMQAKLNSDIQIAIHFRVINPESTFQSDLYKKFIDYGFICKDVTNIFTTFGGCISQNDVPDGVIISTVDNSCRNIDCVIPYSEYTICPNGGVVMCGCFDFSEKTIAGNLNTSSLVDIWKNETYQKFRTGFSRNTIPNICLTCSCYNPVTNIFSNRGLQNYNPVGGETFWHFLQ
jgi:MoaA/NifB/PqqE/SkfB family radical SAM enzyme